MSSSFIHKLRIFYLDWLEKFCSIENTINVEISLISIYLRLTNRCCNYSILLTLMKWLCYHVSFFKQFLFLIQATLLSWPPPPTTATDCHVCCYCCCSCFRMQGPATCPLAHTHTHTPYHGTCPWSISIPNVYVLLFCFVIVLFDSIVWLNVVMFNNRFSEFILTRIIYLFIVMFLIVSKVLTNWNVKAWTIIKTALNRNTLDDRDKWTFLPSPPRHPTLITWQCNSIDWIAITNACN